MLSFVLISVVIIGCMTDCPDGVGVMFGTLVPFGVCRGMLGMYYCNEEGTAVMNDVCIEGDNVYDPGPQDRTMWFHNFTCDAITDCNYFVVHKFSMDTVDVETCDSDEGAQFGHGDCEPTDCSMPDWDGDTSPLTYIYTEYPNNPFFEFMLQPFHFLINECVPDLTYHGGYYGNWNYSLTGNYTYQRIYSCDPEFSGIGMTFGIYADDNCTVLLEESQISFQGSEVAPVLADYNDELSMCTRVGSCSDESILSPTLAPTNSPTQAPVPTESPTNYPTESPTPPTPQPTSNPTNPETTSIPTHSPSLENSSTTNDIFAISLIAMVFIYIL